MARNVAITAARSFRRSGPASSSSKVARRLSELFRDLPQTSFSTATWRRAVQYTANRAGLLASGDLVAAARVLNAERDGVAVRELARFAVSESYAALRAKLLKI